MTSPLTVTMSFGDYLAANILYQRRYWLWSGLLKTFCLTSVLFFALMLAATAFDAPISWPLVIANLIGGILFGLGMTVFMPILCLIAMRRTARRTFDQLSLGLPTTYELDASGLRAANRQSTSTLVWSDLADFVQDGRLLLLRRTPRLFFVLPKAQLASEELDALLTLLRGVGVKEG